jgi:hypothetical protein
MNATLDLSGWAAGAVEADLVLVVATGSATVVPAGLWLAAISDDSYVIWHGSVAVSGVAADGTSGRATFVDLPVTGAPPSGWPRTLAGELEWTCF